MSFWWRRTPTTQSFRRPVTVAQWVRDGIDVIFVVVTSGDKGTPDREMTDEKLRSLREREATGRCRQDWS